MGESEDTEQKGRCLGPCLQGALQVAYRCLNLTEDQQAKYVAHPNDPSRDYFSFDGFTSASTSPSKALDILQEWKCNTMFIIGQGRMATMARSLAAHRQTHTPTFVRVDANVLGFFPSSALLRG